MPIFISKKKRTAIITNYKVLYTTLYREGSVEMHNTAPNLISLLLRGKIKSEHHQNYLLVRNPFTRLESFFKDKFRKDIDRVMKENADWQLSQQVFFDQLKVDQSMDKEAIGQIFLNASFEDFIKSLPSAHLLDHHLHPQSFILQYKIRLAFIKLSIRLKINKTIKIECKKSMDELASELNIDLKNKMNNTNRKQWNEEMVWTNSMVDLVNEIYNIDFQTFRYSRKIENKLNC